MSESTATETVDLTNVTVDTVLELCQELGCVVGELKSYMVVEAPTFNKKCLYVGKAKRRMTRLDISGFEPEAHAAISPLSGDDAKALKLGAVRGQILPKEIREESTDVLEAVRAAVRGLLAEGDGFKLGKRQVKEEEIASSEPEATDSSEEETAEIEVDETQIEEAAEAAAS
jgi:hypothetical protein